MIVQRNSPIESPGGHYTINSSTLSLIINNVTEGDTSAYYQCELMVRDPEAPQTYDILELDENLITLIVLGKFSIIIIPSSIIIIPSINSAQK